MSVKTTIIPDAQPRGTFEKQDTRDGKTVGISKRSHEKIGDCEQSTDYFPTGFPGNFL